METELEETEQVAFIARQRGDQQASASRTVPPVRSRDGSYSVKEQGMGGLQRFSRWVGGEVVGSQHHQPSGSNLSGLYVLVGSVQLISSMWWGPQHLQNRSKDVAQNLIYSL